MIHVDLQYLEPYGVKIQPLERVLFQRNRHLWDDLNLKMVKALLDSPKTKAQTKDYSDVVKIGSPDEVSEDTLRRIRKGLEAFIPWKKGPFEVFGTKIDAEWRSDLKWKRIAPYLDPLAEKSVCDIGSNNGYFMFRSCAQKPRLVFGMDPTRRVKLTFEYLQTFAREKNLKTELLGFEHLPFFQETFDVIFCMGILYHHSDPVSILKDSLGALRPGGQLILETMGISGKEPVCIFPEKRYASMKNVWFIPTQSVIETWLMRAGFEDIRLIANEVLSVEEQRVTLWSPGKSLADFLDPLDESKTMEGYERPSRIYFTARKKRKRKRPGF